MHPDPLANIYWLASYPKSGNTWARAFIVNLLDEAPEAVSINELHTGCIASMREWVESALGFEINELSHDEADSLRPAAYCWISQQLTSPGYHKIHDAYSYLPNGQPLIPTESTKGALCIIRNPLDVAVSFAHHSGWSIDQTIENMGNEKFAFCSNNRRFYTQLRHKLLSWSAHVTSWIDAPAIKTHVVRYEDMKLIPIDTFSQIAAFLELPFDRQSITESLKRCSFEELQAQEQQSNFKEKWINSSDLFFRKGIVGDWMNNLTDRQITRLVTDHRLAMERFGYLDSQGNPLMFDEASVKPPSRPLHPY